MARVRSGAVTKARHKKVLKQAKGYFGSKHRLYKTAKEQLMTSGQYAFRDRRQKKRDFRKLWITRINAACRLNEISYSRFIEGLTKAGVEVNRKMLSEIAINNPKAFTELVKVARDGKAGKIVKAMEVTGNEVTVNKLATKKAEVKKEVAEKKEEVKEKVEEKKATVKKQTKEIVEKAKSVGKEAKEKAEKTAAASKEASAKRIAASKEASAKRVAKATKKDK